MQQAGQILTSFLKTRHGSIPKGLIFKFSLATGGHVHNRNGDALTGAMLVLADAALSGVPPEGMVYAKVAMDGSIKLPTRFWQTMRVLADQEELTRLVLPNEASRFLPPIITLDRSEFFFSHEVLLAGDASGLCDLASSAPAANVVEAHAIIEAIRTARGTRSLGGFLNHSSTQQRLRQVVETLPEHASAWMLALRGTSKWPKRLPRDIYAREIRAALEPVRGQFLMNGWRGVKASNLDALADESRDQLEAVEKLAGSVSDRDLHESAEGMVKELHRLVAEIKRATTNRDLIRPVYMKTWREYNSVMEALTQAAGDESDYPLPSVK